jgi:hypothetical protein
MLSGVLSIAGDRALTPTKCHPTAPSPALSFSRCGEIRFVGVENDKKKARNKS